MITKAAILDIQVQWKGYTTSFLTVDFCIACHLLTFRQELGGLEEAGLF